MNNLFSKIFGGIFISGLFIIVILTSTASQSQVAHSSTNFAQVHNPRIPQKITICGQEIDLTNQGYYERFDRELTSVTYTHGTTLLIIKRANRYFPQMAPILRANNMPEDLLYLACIESMLQPRIKSNAGAAGIWQFMPQTAREYGLEVNDYVDERYNIEKATKAACKYFKKALATYGGDWTSAMASYNAGMGRISTGLESQSANSGIELYLTEETMRYPFRVAAMKTIMENPRNFGFILTADQLYQPRKVKIVEVNGSVESWAEWAIAHGTSYIELRDENPWINNSKLTNPKGKTYSVRIPINTSIGRTATELTTYNTSWVAE